jgi:hypothetical protein
LRGHAEMEEAVYENLIDLGQFFSVKKAAAQKQRDALHALAAMIEEQTPPAGATHFNESGGCWLWLTHNRHPLVRAPIHLNAITINENSRYLVELPEFDADRPLRQREEMAKALAKQLETKFGISASYFSVLRSHNPDHIPTYSDDLVSHPLFYNLIGKMTKTTKARRTSLRDARRRRQCRGHARVHRRPAHFVAGSHCR